MLKLVLNRVISLESSEPGVFKVEYLFPEASCTQCSEVLLHRDSIDRSTSIAIMRMGMEP